MYKEDTNNNSPTTSVSLKSLVKKLVKGSNLKPRGFRSQAAILVTVVFLKKDILYR